MPTMPSSSSKRVALAPAPAPTLQAHPHVNAAAMTSTTATTTSARAPLSMAGTPETKKAPRRKPLVAKVKAALVGDRTKRPKRKGKVGPVKLPPGLQFVDNVVRFEAVRSLTSRPKSAATRHESPRGSSGAGAAGGRPHVASCTCGQCIKAKKAARHAPIQLRYKASIRLVEATLESGKFVKTAKDDWNVLWVSGAVRPHLYQSLLRHQKVNQFPRTYEITRKDQLCRNMRRMQELHGGHHFDFFPQSFVLPADRSEFQREAKQAVKRAESARSASAKDPPDLWIVKPAASACGRGIYLTDNLADIPLSGGEDGNVLVSKYISNPLLMDQRKFDLRIYVAVTSFNPLRVFVYEEGLVRLTTENYRNDAESLRNRYVHLTNYSVQKKSKKFVSNDATAPDRLSPAAEDPSSPSGNKSPGGQSPGATSEGCARARAGSKNQHEAEGDDDETERASKWSLQTFRARLERMGHDAAGLFSDIDELIIKTLISIEPQVLSAMDMHVRHTSNCFQLFGFDVLVDESLKPWLLEVNLGPSLGCDSALDLQIKSSMIADLLTLAGVQACDVHRKRGEEPFVTAKPSLAPAPSADRLMRDLEAEKRRAGGWKCVYPSPTSFIYDRFFANKRERNQMVVERLSAATSHSDRLRIERRIHSSAKTRRAAATASASNGTGTVVGPSASTPALRGGATQAKLNADE